MPPVKASTRPRLISVPFVIVTLATFAFFCFVGLVVTILPRFIEHELGGDGVAIGVNLAVFSVAAVAARPLIARIGDRLGRRWLMVGGSLLAGATVATTGFVSSIVALVPLRALSGIGEAALFVGAATLISDLSPPRRRAEGASYFSLAVFGGLGVGPVVGEIVLGDGNYRAAFVAGALFCASAALIALAAPNRVAGVARAAVGERAPLYHRAAFLPGLVLAFAIAGYAGFNAFLPTHAEDIGMTPSGPFVLYSLLCVLFRLVGARFPERVGLGNAVTGALVTLASGLALLGLLDQPHGVYLATVVVAMGMALLYPSLMAFTVNSVSEEDRARALSTFTMFFEVGIAAGGLILGPVSRWAGDRGAFVVGALLVLVGLWVLRRRLLPAMALRRHEHLTFESGLVAGD
jgi:MFS family permease